MQIQIRIQPKKSKRIRIWIPKRIWKKLFLILTLKDVPLFSIILFTKRFIPGFFEIPGGICFFYFLTTSPPCFFLFAQVDIKLSITSQVAPSPVERRESVLSQASSEEETEFDSEAIIVPPRSPEEREAAKPKLSGRKLTVYPMSNKDSELSGLCSIM